MDSTQDPRWLAFSPKWRKTLLEKHRDCNTNHHDWHEDVYACFKEECATHGIEIDRMSFSGFWSQGDGASFLGSVDDWDKFLKHTGQDGYRLATIAAGRQNFAGWSLRIVNGYGHNMYSHEHTVTSSFDYDLENGFEQTADPLRHAAYKLMLDELETPGAMDALEATFLEACRALMRKLYTDLEAEHEYLTSDELVVDFILEYLDADETRDPDAEEEEYEEEDEEERRTHPYVVFV